MHIRTSYDQAFDDLMLHLKSKYPKELFDLEGIGKQLDMSQFSKDFFAVKTTADVSVDANSNIEDMSVITYNTELPKPFFKLNSYYILWKHLRALYGHEAANKIIEMQLTGDIYINDFHGIAAGAPYSYHPHTSIWIQQGDSSELVTMEKLFDRYAGEIVNLPDRETIDLKGKHIKILDQHGQYTELLHVLRHKTDKKLLKLETKNGYSTLVTEDHPVILADGSEKLAANLTLSDSLAVSAANPTRLSGVVDLDYAYLVGFFLGDGFASVSNAISKNGKAKNVTINICQKDVEGSKAYSCLSKFFGAPYIYKAGRIATIHNRDEAENWRKWGVGSHNKHLPTDVLNWGASGVKALIAGLIDSDGNINSKNGIVTIRVTSFALAQQVGELLRMFNAGVVRVSFAGKYSSKLGHKSDSEIYRVSVRMTDREYLDYSEKVSKYEAIIYREMQKDGRFETAQLHRIEPFENAVEYVYDITTSTGHFHSQGLLQHNCFNYSTYDIMLLGLPMVSKIKSLPPKYLYAFKSQLEQFVVIASNSTLGATGLADMLIVMSYYAKNILETKSDAHFSFKDEEACWSYIKECLVSFIYTINQPMRANQSPFTNISVYDKAFLESLCPNYVFPDGSTPDTALVEKLQEVYIDIMNAEMARTPITFPVTTACFAVDDEGTIQDEEFAGFIAEKNLKYGFINIYSGKSSTLSSCCRLRSEQENEYFNSFGSGSSKIGSLGVVTINLPRLAYKYAKRPGEFLSALRELVGVCAKINNAKRHIVKRRADNGNLPLYSLGFMELSKQYSTTGVNGLNECCEIMGHDILEAEGQEFVLTVLDCINSENNRYQKQYKTPHNCEQIPGENSSIKLADKDRLMGMNAGYDIYSNQFIPLVTGANMLDRIRLQGLFDKHFSGGAICHINVEQQITDPTQIVELIKAAAKMGVVYWAVNYNIQRCEHGHMGVGKGENCTVCGGAVVDNFTRVVGFLTSVKNWHKVRRTQDYPNRQFYGGIGAHA